MKKYLIGFVIICSGCELVDEIKSIDKIDGPCQILLMDGELIETSDFILMNGGTITYRDEDQKLRSLFKSDYRSFKCGD